MKKIMAYVIRFIRNSRCKTKERNLKPLNRDEVSMAAVHLIRYTQHENFLEEVQCLKSNTILPKSSQLKALNPFLDSDGIIRIGGRLEYSTLVTSIKHPILLPRKSELTTAILQDIHHQFYHAGISFMLNFLRQQFWLIRAKDEIRQVVRKCVKCFKQKPLRQQQLMGDLPPARAQYVHPFHKDQELGVSTAKGGIAPHYMVYQTKIERRNSITQRRLMFTILNYQLMKKKANPAIFPRPILTSPSLQLLILYYQPHWSKSKTTPGSSRYIEHYWTPHPRHPLYLKRV